MTGSSAAMRFDDMLRRPVRLAAALMLAAAMSGCAAASGPGGSTGVGASGAPGVTSERSGATSGAASSVKRDVASAPVEPTGGRSGVAIGVPDICALVTPAEIEAVVGMAVDAGQDVTAETGWSSACAWVQTVAAGTAPYNVNVKVLAHGTLAAFKTISGAHPVAGLADEAYAFDDGRQVALRFGELVAVVAGARGIDGNGVPASAVEALARLMADRIRG